MTTYTIGCPSTGSDPIRPRTRRLLSVATYTAGVSRTVSRPLRRVTPTVSRMNDSVGIRQAISARVLRLAHLEVPSRARPSRPRPGLNRSTIADLVGALVALGLVEERAPDPAGASAVRRRSWRRIPEWSRSRSTPRWTPSPWRPSASTALATAGAHRGGPPPRPRARPRSSSPSASPRGGPMSWPAPHRRDRHRGAGPRPRVGRPRPRRPAPAVERRRAARSGRAGDRPPDRRRQRRRDGRARRAPLRRRARRRPRRLPQRRRERHRRRPRRAGVAGDRRRPATPASSARTGPRIAADADRRADDGVLEDEVSRARLLAALGRAHADEPTSRSAADLRRAPKCSTRSPGSAASWRPRSRTPSTSSIPRSWCSADFSGRWPPTTRRPEAGGRGADDAGQR